MSTKQKSPLFIVGLFLLVGLVLIGGLIIKYGSSDQVNEGYELVIEFDDASGIIEGGLVRLAGANVGHVSVAPTLNANRKVDVTVMIREDLVLPTNALFEIVPLSLLGDKAIFINIPEQEDSTSLKDGDRLAGAKASGIEALQSNAEKITEEAVIVMQKANETFEQLNLTLEEYKEVAQTLNTTLLKVDSELFTKEKLAKIGATVENFHSASGSINEMTREMQPLVGEVRSTLNTIQSATRRAELTMESIDNQVAALEPAIEEVPKTLKSFSRTAVKFETTLDTMQGEDSLLGAITQDKEVKDDAKTFIKNLKNNGILGYKDNSDPNADDPRDRYRGLRR